MKQTLVAPSALVNNQDLIEPAVIEIDSGVITKVRTHIPKKAENMIMLDDMLLLPGFTNAHAHLELTSLGVLTEHNFVPWMKELMHAKTMQTAADVVRSLEEGCQKLIKTGSTTNIDHISFDSPITAYRKLPCNVIGFGEVLGSIEPISRHIYDKLKDLQRASPIDFHLSLHTIHTVHETIINEFFQNEHPPFSIHLCEYAEEQEYFQNNSGPFYDFVVTRYPELNGLKRHQAPSAIQYLKQHNRVLNNSLIIHANYCDDHDIDILSTWKNICIVHCPGSFAFFDHAHFPFKQYREQNIKIALGTDGLVSNNELNYFSEIQLFLEMFPEIGLKELMPMITTNALETIGITNRGLIKEGYFADIIGLTCKKQQDICETLSQTKNVSFCMINGLSQQGL
ncbi:amidohydrolase family protein [bacterium]|nr:amidohydrolase family protein [bacterium]MBU1917056.1 amidohydrolase family protein [bacterium]